MEHWKMIYVSSADPLAIIGALAVMGALLAPVLRSREPMEEGDWRRIRLSFLLPLFISPLLALVYGEGFGAMRLLFHTGATAYPIWGLGLLWIVHRRDVEAAWHRYASIAMCVTTLALVPLAAWMVLGEPYRLEVTQTEVDTDAENVEPIRVVMLADVQTDQFGAWEEYVLDEVNRLDADIVVLPGDLLQTFPQGYAEQLPKTHSFLRRLEASHGVYIVGGDADALPSDYDIAETTVLENDIVEFDVRGRHVALAGTQNAYDSRLVDRTLEQLEEHDAELKLVLAHRPMTATRAPRAASTIDLVMAGHTHGGQVALPLVGPPITLSEAPREVGAGGLNELGGRQIYVSRGVGMERHDAPRIRLGARPELALLLIE
jgi:hypothetical protein